MSKKKEIIFFQVVGILLIGILMLTTIVIDISDFDMIWNYKRTEYNSNQTTMNGIDELEDGSLMNVTDDPQIYIDNASKCIEVEIEIIKTEAELSCQVFYAKGGENFTEEKSVRVTLNEGKNSISIPNEGYTHIRLDIGDQNQVYTLGTVTVNPDIYIIKKIFMNVAIVIVYAFFSYIVCTWDSWKTRLGFLHNRKLYNKRVITLIFSCIVLLSIFVLKINFSSFKSYELIIPNNIQQVDSTTIGKVRWIRSDEWGVVTPIQLAQGSGTENSPSKTDILGEESSIATVGIPIPTLDISIIGKPFTWGFVLFGSEIGFSWYYVMRVVALLIFSYLLLNIICKSKKWIACCGSFIITFSPGIQWWQTTGAGVMESIIYLEMILVSLFFLFNKDVTLRRKFFCSLSLLISTVGFTLLIYPALQVPLTYLGIMLLIGFYLEYKEKIEFNRKNILLFIITVILYILIVGTTILRMSDDLINILNTIYPGKRVSTGGGLQWSYFFNSLINFILPFKDADYSNSSELSTFITLFPVTIAVYFLNRRKIKKNYIVDCMMIYLGITAFIMVIGLPTVIAKITLFSFVPENRLFIVFSYASVMLLIVLLSYKETFSGIKYQYVLWGLYIYIGIMKHNEIFRNLGLEYFIVINLVIIILIYLLNYKKNIAITLLVAITVVTGCTINPINFGTSIMTDTNFSKIIKSIDNENTGVWATVDDVWLSKYITAQGIKTLNSLNYPPKMDTWTILDPENSYEEAYNRYAHVRINLVNEELTDKFELLNADVFCINVTIEELSTLGVDYVVSREELSGLELVGFDELDNIYIYRI